MPKYMVRWAVVEREIYDRNFVLDFQEVFFDAATDTAAYDEAEKFFTEAEQKEQPMIGAVHELFKLMPAE